MAVVTQIEPGLASGRGEHDEGCRRNDAPVPLVCLGAADAATVMQWAKAVAESAGNDAGPGQDPIPNRDVKLPV